MLSTHVDFILNNSIYTRQIADLPLRFFLPKFQKGEDPIYIYVYVCVCVCISTQEKL
jgi:hypothetical protein